MAIAAQLAPADERGGGARRMLRLETRGLTAAGAAPVRVHNVSATGLLIETGAPLARGEALAVELPHAGLIAADVIWSSGAFHGCQFAAPIDPATLSAIALRSDSPPSDDEAQGQLPLRDGFGQHLQRLRRQRGLTLSQVAEQLAVSKPTVWAWEHDRSRPVDSRIEALASALGVGREELVAGAAASDPVSEAVSTARARIAEAAGTAPERIRILIEL